MLLTDLTLFALACFGLFARCEANGDDITGLRNITELSATSPNVVVPEAAAVILPVSDPNNPPTLEYYCGILVQVCANAQVSLMQGHLSPHDGEATTDVITTCRTSLSRRASLQEQTGLILPSCTTIHLVQKAGGTLLVLIRLVKLAKYTLDAILCVASFSGVSTY